MVSVLCGILIDTFANKRRSSDGLTLLMSSSDGFCSTLSFAPGELGQPYTASLSTTVTQTATSAPSTSQNPLPTPTYAPSPGNATNIPLPPASPARSNSASSNTTPSIHQQASQPASVINNPTPTLGSVPLVTAAHSAQPPTLPLTTPPQTPMSSVSQSGSGTNSSTTVLGKRDASETGSGKEESKEAQDSSSSAGQSQQQPKKRRVAPTLVSGNGNN